MPTWNTRARNARPAGSCSWERLGGLIPWRSLEDRIRPHYPKAGKGRRRYPLAVMLQVHCVQLCYNLSDPGMEDLLYEAESVRRFVGQKLSEALADETTILNFRHVLEKHNLGPGLLEEINSHLESQGLRMREGTIVDASIIEAPSSTKNRAGERDSEMYQTKKGNRWHFGTKAHIGVYPASAERGDPWSRLPRPGGGLPESLPCLAPMIRVAPPKREWPKSASSKAPSSSHHEKDPSPTKNQPAPAKK